MLSDVLFSRNGKGINEGLNGEVTILDGKPAVSTVDNNGKPGPSKADLSQLQATMFVGAQVNAWT